MVERKSLKEFRDTGLLLIVNQILHIFGWAIVIKVSDGEETDMYPARVKYRGFDVDSVSDAYKKISSYMSHNANKLLKESKMK